MKRTVAVLLLLGCLALSACARPSPQAPEATPAAAPSPAPAQSPETVPAPTPAPSPGPVPAASEAPSPSPAPEGAEAFSGEGPVHFPAPDEAPVLPDSSSEYSLTLAMSALTLCTGHGQDPEKRVLEEAGFTVLKQANYDKPPEDVSHTCAWTLGKRSIPFRGKDRTLFIVAIRGTSGGEWISNFDFAPSHDDDTEYAENFLLCAQEVLDGIREELEQEAEPLLLICGHSRGAACANLLGVLLDEERGPEDVYVYTFATPATVRGAALEKDCPNVFNLLNPCDVVTLVPPLSLGYGRAGQDVVLPNSRETAEGLQAAMGALEALTPSVSAYYEVRHSLTGPGLSDDGMTVFEFMCLLAGGFEGAAADLPEIAPDSDLAPLTAMNAGGMDASLLMQHMPLTYQALMLASSMFS